MLRSTGGRVCAALVVGGLLTVTGCSRSKSTSTGSPVTTVPVAVGDADFGTMKSVCGPAAGTNVATGRGVTADSIRVGTISDAGFVGKPGLNKELWDGSDVFVKWCNSFGGINGRKIVDTHLDAAITQYKQKILEGCQSDFALVGGGGVLDDAGEPARISCLLPSFPGFLLTPTARASEFEWSPIPAPLGEINARGFRWLQKQFPDSVTNVGFLTANLSATVVVGQQIKEATKKLGFTTGGFDEQYNSLGESSWVPFATAMKQKGVKGLMFLGEPQDLAKLEQAMTAISYKPVWIATLPNIYDRDFTKATAGGPVNTYVPVRFFPFELADAKAPGSEAMQKYLSLFAKYSPKGKVRSSSAVAAFAAWLLFAEAAKPCGANLTVKCLYEHAQKITDFDAGGLVAPANPAGNKGSPCETGVKANATGFTVVDKETTKGPFNCDPANNVTLTGNYGKGVTLASVGKSVADLK